MNMPEPNLSAAGSAAFLSENPTISGRALVKACQLGKYTEIACDANLQECSLGDYSYVMERCEIACADIGKFVNIASDVRINPGNHPIEWVSQHHFLYRMRQYGFRDHDDERFFSWRKLQRVRIGHDVWLGHKAIVMPGITIGNGAVIGAASVVTRDVAPYAVVVGSPAKQIRTRFPKAICQEIEDIGWWDWDHQTIGERLDDFRDVRKFIDMYGKSGTR